MNSSCSALAVASKLDSGSHVLCARPKPRHLTRYSMRRFLTRRSHRDSNVWTCSPMADALVALHYFGRHGALSGCMGFDVIAERVATALYQAREDAALATEMRNSGREQEAAAVVARVEGEMRTATRRICR